MCDKCKLREKKGCPTAESCSVDVIRLDAEGKPYIAYPEDCHICFLCSRDCPMGAVEVSGMIPSLALPY
ncbi:MAG: [Fe-S]-binding protein [Chloroflexi bacterium]|nr:[Fe-S]-binding protein [Chloroflexota bacterium]